MDGFPPAPAGAAASDYTYIIGAGDSLNIIVWRNPELSLSVPVRPDGKVSAPLVDELVAQGKTSSEVARDI
jgi:polysaccharide biosynthesis/export protein